MLCATILLVSGRASRDAVGATAPRRAPRRAPWRARRPWAPRRAPRRPPWAPRRRPPWRAPRRAWRPRAWRAPRRRPVCKPVDRWASAKLDGVEQTLTTRDRDLLGGLGRGLGRLLGDGALARLLALRLLRRGGRLDDLGRRGLALDGGLGLLGGDDRLGGEQPLHLADECGCGGIRVYELDV